jgi:hypothetical protein
LLDSLRVFRACFWCWNSFLKNFVWLDFADYVHLALNCIFNKNLAVKKKHQKIDQLSWILIFLIRLCFFPFVSEWERERRRRRSLCETQRERRWLRLTLEVAARRQRSMVACFATQSSTVKGKNHEGNTYTCLLEWEIRERKLVFVSTHLLYELLLLLGLPFTTYTSQYNYLNIFF